MRKAVSETKTQSLVHMTYHDCCFPLLLIFLQGFNDSFLDWHNRMDNHTVSRLMILLPMLTILRAQGYT